MNQDLELKIGVTRAVAIAATNALVQHLGLGLFLSDLHIFDYKRRGPGIIGVPIVGRTDKNFWVEVLVESNKKHVEGTDQFPIEEVVISIKTLGPEEGLYYRCHLTETKILIQKLGKLPHEDPDKERVEHTGEVRRIWAKGEGAGFHET